MIGKVVAFIFGSIVGSFLNVCIYRMPKAESVVWPGSRCPHCNKKIPAYDNIPFISYLILRGQCRMCKHKISLRYPLIELLTAVMFVVFYNRYGLTYDFLIYLIFLSTLIIASFIDIRHRIIPDEVSIGGMMVGFILKTIKGINLIPVNFNVKPMLNSLLGIIIGGGLLYLTGLLFDLFYFKLFRKPPIQGQTSSMGGGDIKLLSMIGAFLGWEKVLLTFFLAPFLGAAVGIVNLIVKKDHTIPYGPFLSLASLVALFWADKIINFIMFIRFSY